MLDSFLAQGINNFVHSVARRNEYDEPSRLPDLEDGCTLVYQVTRNREGLDRIGVQRFVEALNTTARSESASRGKTFSVISRPAGPPTDDSPPGDTVYLLEVSF